MSAGTPEAGWRVQAKALVSTLEIPPGPIAEAIASVPRHLFVPRELQRGAYLDAPLPIGVDATISAPSMVAEQLGWAALEPGMHVLELGSGSGYLVALLAVLTGPSGLVAGVEVEPALAESARRALRETGLSVSPDITVGEGDGGFPPSAPYDRILVSYAIRPPFPQPWWDQLTEAGFLVAPVDRGRGTHLERARRSPEGWRIETGPACRFVGRKPRAAQP